MPDYKPYSYIFLLNGIAVGQASDWMATLALNVIFLLVTDT